MQKKLTVFIEGIGSEFVQGTIKKEELDTFKSSGLSWQDYCIQEVKGYGINTGHYLAEENPEEIIKSINSFF